MIRVLVVDDHPIVRRGTCEILADAPDLEVVGEGCNGAEAIELVARLQPDVLVMDVSMPVLDGVEATRRLMAVPDGPGILILSAGGEDDQILGALRAGALGYLLKTAPDELLIEAVRLVEQRKPAVLQPEVTRVLVGGVSEGTGTRAASELLEPLSDREIEVLREVAKDLGNKQIASRLAISDRTVQQHLANVYGKLGVSSRTGAVLKALQLRLLSLEDCKL